MDLTSAIDTAKVAYQAGFRGSNLVIAVAIAGAESTFNPKATGDLAIQDAKWGPSVGLWQIRTLKPGSLHLEPIRDIRDLYDPLKNAQAAFAISKGGTNFKPWSTYINNAYQHYQDLATEATVAFEDIKKKTPMILLLIALIAIVIFSLK